MRTIVIFFTLAYFLHSCNKTEIENKTVNFKNFSDWWTYYNTNIKLYSNFQAKNSSNITISKKQFLDSLKTGKYLPIILNQNKNIYYLQKNESNDKSITSTIKQEAEINDANYSWEGKKFPKFNFTDLEGNNYTTENTLDKTIFLKTFFINCQACNEEMPKLNEFIDNNKNENYIFLSLALDDKEKLAKFLYGKNYKYYFIPTQRNFIKNDLKSNIFPTHFVIKNGIVKKVVNGASQLIDFANSK